MSQDAVAEVVSRARAWTLLGELILKGVSSEVYPVVTQLPVFAALIPPETSADQLGAEHQRVFGFEVFPFESVFLGEDGKLGGRVTESVSAAYEQSGFPGRRSDVESDHLGIQCAFLGSLSAREAKVLELGGADLDQITAAQRQFLDGHLLAWLPAMVASVRGVGSPFWIAVVEMCLELGLEQRRGLGGERYRPERVELPSLISLLDNPDTRLKDVARFVLSPAHFGCFLGRKTIGEVAIAADGPPGFGGRFQLLESGMFGAVDRGQWASLVDAIASVTQVHREILLELEAAGAPVERWLELLGRSAEGLAILRAGTSQLCTP